MLLCRAAASADVVDSVPAVGAGAGADAIAVTVAVAVTVTVAVVVAVVGDWGDCGAGWDVGGCASAFCCCVKGFVSQSSLPGVGGLGVVCHSTVTVFCARMLVSLISRNLTSTPAPITARSNHSTRGERKLKAAMLGSGDKVGSGTRPIATAPYCGRHSGERCGDGLNK